MGRMSRPLTSATLGPLGEFELVVLLGPDRGQRLRLGTRPLRIGTGIGCALRLSDPDVESEHLELQAQGDRIAVEHLPAESNSRFGGARFSRLEVKPGAVLEIGQTILKVTTIEHFPRPLPSMSDRFFGLIGPSLAMREVFALLELVSQTDVPVLIEGETGTGKELCAEALVQASARRSAPFVVCDLAGIPRSVIESELFGHVRGAFTGAERDRDGAFAQAHLGTIFIDELGELELQMQPRLLRAIEQKKVKPVGASAYRDVDVRIVSATNRDLRLEARAGRFRPDLYHRLSVVRIRLPPLRDRKEDLPSLVEHFLAGRDIEVPKETLRLFAEYDWPGNVRELRNVIDRGLSLLGGARVLHPGLLGLDELLADPPQFPSDGSPTSVQVERMIEPFKTEKERLVARWEREYLSKLLRGSAGNVAEAARRGGLDRVHLHRLIKKHGIDNWY
jgi:two-component system nitrogen regulation response regulator GlnG